jgi:hypothetical protein
VLRISRWRKRAVDVTVARWTGKPEDIEEAAEFLGGDLVGTRSDEQGRVSLLIRTLERDAEPDVIPPGWHLVQGVLSEHYGCEPQAFALTYDPVDQPETDKDRAAREIHEGLLARIAELQRRLAGLEQHLAQSCTCRPTTP